MEHLRIIGQTPLNGTVSVSGAKNAAVAIIPAALLSCGLCVIDNLPNIEDVSSLIDSLTKIGVNCERRDSNTLAIDASGLEVYRANFDSVRKIRASYYLIGAFLGRFGRAEVALPGGCNFGSRPIDQHIKGFEAMGATISIEHGMVIAEAKQLKGANIYLDIASVGATINIMMAAALADGRTVIENAAREPHIVDTANFLNILGADIKGAGTDVIRINGVERLQGGEYTIIPDQIEAGTFMIAAAITNGNVRVNNVIPKHMDSVSAKLREVGAEVIEGDDNLTVIGRSPISSAHIKTMYYPGFPTDLQPQMAALLTLAIGTSYVTETVFENRYQYINEMKRLGSDITVDGRMAVIEGVSRLTGADVTATDLRAGAALVVAALAAEGQTTISNVKYIDRGYENMEGKLRQLGANIHRISS